LMEMLYGSGSNSGRRIAEAGIESGLGAGWER
jgi:hypothetical protein